MRVASDCNDTRHRRTDSTGNQKEMTEAELGEELLKIYLKNGARVTLRADHRIRCS